MNTTSLADGAYQYTSTPTYRASFPVLTIIEGGRVTAYATGEGEAQTWASAARLADLGGLLLAQLAAEIATRRSAGACMAQVNFCPVKAAPTIGKARAAKLHKIMTRVGVPSVHHYASAARATGREVWSLAGLTEREARQTWAYLCRMFPAAQHAA
ncbi:hypothetical protein [Deinococcus sp.]|uniref:hypothetical protein n=1 Tax=Deinococcus sp. TaxID=47478 RepID=UPI0025FA8F80|nr:hypothetical protein [Deinococcus sp.]